MMIHKLTLYSSASQGLGQQILAAFCLSGGHGAVVDLSLSSAKKSIETINAEVQSAGLPPSHLRPYECNTADESAVKSTFAQIVKDFGKVDVLCTNAGITGGEAAEDYDFGDWKGMLDVNVNGTFLFAKEAGKHMIEQKIKGSIIMVSSMSGVIVNRPQKQSAYNAVSVTISSSLPQS
jgi:sorbose reductase